MKPSRWVAEKVFTWYYNSDKQENITILEQALLEQGQAHTEMDKGIAFYKLMYEELGGNAYILHTFGYNLQRDVFDRTKKWVILSSLFAFFMLSVAIVWEALYAFINLFMLNHYTGDLELFSMQIDGRSAIFSYRLLRLSVLFIMSVILIIMHKKLSSKNRAYIALLTSVFTWFSSVFLTIYAVFNMPQNNQRVLSTKRIVILSLLGVFSISSRVFINSNIERMSPNDFYELDYGFNYDTTFKIPLESEDLPEGISWQNDYNFLQINTYYIETTWTIDTPYLTFPDGYFTGHDGVWSYNLYVEGIPLCDNDIEIEITNGTISASHPLYENSGCKQNYNEHNMHLDDLSFDEFSLTMVFSEQSQIAPITLLNIPDPLRYAYDSFYEYWNVDLQGNPDFSHTIRELNIKSRGNVISVIDVIVETIDVSVFPYDLMEDTDIHVQYEIGGVLLDEQVTVHYISDDYYNNVTIETLHFNVPSIDAPQIFDFMYDTECVMLLEYTDSGGDVQELRILLGTIDDLMQYKWERM